MSSSRDIPHYDTEIHKENYREGLLEILSHVKPKWPKDSIKFKGLKEGMVNNLIGCFIGDGFDEDTVVARIWGKMFARFLPRDQEKSCSMCFADLGVAPAVYCSFKNGICTGFVTGTPYTWEDLPLFRDVDMGKRIARTLAVCHSDRATRLAKEKYHIQSGVVIMKAAEQVLETWPTPIDDSELYDLFYGGLLSKEELVTELELIKQVLQKSAVPDTFCHGDVSPTNFIYNEITGRLSLVDHEMAGVKDPIVDLATFLLMSSVGISSADIDGLKHTPEYERAFLREYLEVLDKENGSNSLVTENRIEGYRIRILKMSLAFYLVAALFTPEFVANAKEGINLKEFIRLAKVRLQYYMDHKDTIFALEVPE